MRPIIGARTSVDMMKTNWILFASSIAFRLTLCLTDFPSSIFIGGKFISIAKLPLADDWQCHHHCHRRRQTNAWYGRICNAMRWHNVQLQWKKLRSGKRQCWLRWKPNDRRSSILRMLIYRWLSSHSALNELREMLFATFWLFDAFRKKSEINTFDGKFSTSLRINSKSGKNWKKKKTIRLLFEPERGTSRYEKSSIEISVWV